jgi:hypothetical protein
MRQLLVFDSQREANQVVSTTAFPWGDASICALHTGSVTCPNSDNLHGDCQFLRHPYKVRGGRRRARGDGRPRRSCSKDTIPISSRSRW